MTNNPVVPKAEILGEQQCWTLLGETSIGRLAVTANGHPDVFPINYKVDQGSLIFRTGDGTKFRALSDESVVALEADAVSAEFGMAWSVVVKGRAVSASSADDVLDTTGRSLFPWQGIGKDHLIRVVPDTVTGRRFTLTAPMTWRSPLDDVTRAGFE